MISSLIYLLVGCVTTFIVEKCLVDQGVDTGLGMAYSLGERLRSIVLWPVFTGIYIFDYIQILISSINDQQ